MRVRTLVALLFAMMPAFSFADETPQDSQLVHLRDVDPTIIQDIRYATANNFTGRPVPGYDAAECMLLRPVALALAQVQADLRPEGLSLKVYDCYRPMRAVASFMDTIRRHDASMQKRFFPTLTPDDLISQDYVATVSNHSRGTAVDLTLVPLPPPSVPNFDPSANYGPCTGPVEERAPDNSLDFGTGFDCFDTKSWTASQAITLAQGELRLKLVAAMTKRGFRNYEHEWWHFSFAVPNAQLMDVPVGR